MLPFLSCLNLPEMFLSELSNGIKSSSPRHVVDNLHVSDCIIEMKVGAAKAVCAEANNRIADATAKT